MERPESTETGRVLISALFLGLVVCIAVTTLRPLGASAELTGAAQPVLNATALGQRWGVFAPDPQRSQQRVSVVVGYADGSSWTWRSPHGDYRWRRVANAIGGENAMLRERVARWTAAHGPRRDAVSATVVVARAAIRPRGGHGPWTTVRHAVEIAGPR